METFFTFVRHGETDANISGLLQGQIDCPLNANGLAQADAAAEFLADREFDFIYASNLARAAVTAQKIAGRGHENIPLTLTHELREMDCGDFDGKTWVELRAAHQDKVNIFYRESAGGAFPGGESKAGFQARIDAFLEKMVALHPGKRILLVAHGGVLQRIFRRVAGVGGANTLLPLAGNASVSEFLYSSNQQAWQLTLWNYREHLKDLPQHRTLSL